MRERVFDSFSRFFDELLGSFSDFRGPVIALITIAVLVIAYKVTTGGLKKYIFASSENKESTKGFFFVWRFLWIAVAVVFGVIALSGSLTALGLSAALIGMMLGWALQAPVTGIAGWLMVTIKRPFKIGDRIIIGGVVGDVIGITLTHIILDQVGGTVGGEENSGRTVLIPNATLFQHMIFNYTLDSKYILDEVPLLVTFESDFDTVEGLLLRAAREITEDIVAETGQEPFIRREISDSGVRLRLRYLALAVDRQRISSEIVKIIINDFKRFRSFEFAYPHSEVVVRPKQKTDAEI